MSNICYIHWNVGSHTPFLGDITTTVCYGINQGMRTIQFFMGDCENAWKREKISNLDIENTLSIINHFPTNIFTHYPFCANLAGKSASNGLAWNGNIEIDNRLNSVMRQLQYELSITAKLQTSNKTGVVIHPGSFPNRKLGHETVIKTLNRIEFPNKSILLLENCAGEGNKLCKTFEEIGNIINSLNENQKNHVRVCVDTAHIWGQGDYDLSKIEEVDKMFNDFEKHIGMKYFYLLHLNDSKVPRGSKKDVHELLGQGYIWNKSFDSLIYLMNKCEEFSIPSVLETDCSDMLTLAHLQTHI